MRVVASKVTAAPSTYPLIERRGVTSGGGSERNPTLGVAVGSTAWLAASVRDIVATLGRLGRRPLLQLVFSRSSARGDSHWFQAQPVSQAVADDPQSWDAFAVDVRRSGANGLVLVRPIASPDQFCAFASAAAKPQPQSQSQPQAQQAAPQAARDCVPVDGAASPQSVAPSCRPAAAATGAAQAPPSAAQAWASSAPARPLQPPQPPQPQLEGQVGDCCGSGAGADGPSGSTDRAHAAPRSGGPHPGGRATAAANRGSPPGGTNGSAGSVAGAGGLATDYYGLVVQSSCSSQADGCWVLKVTRNDDGGGVTSGMCACMHFTLTRVCLGQPLYTQLRDAWLAGPPALA